MIYLLHFTTPLQRSNGSAATHYLGWCHENGLDERLEQHRRGWSKVKILQEVLRRGGDLVLVHTWPHGGPALERYLKNNGHLNQFCPICRPQHLNASRRKQARWRRASLDRLEPPTERQQSFSGISTLPGPGGLTVAGSIASAPALPPASSTTSGELPAHAPAGGSTAGSVAAKRSPPASTRSAGTGPPST